MKSEVESPEPIVIEALAVISMLPLSVISLAFTSPVVVNISSPKSIVPEADVIDADEITMSPWNVEAPATCSVESS